MSRPAVAPRRESMLALRGQGFKLGRLNFAGAFDGLVASKVIGEHRVEVFVGAAGDDDAEDLFFTPVVYVDDRRVASCSSVERAARVADLRVLLLRAQAKKEGKQ